MTPRPARSKARPSRKRGAAPRRAPAARAARAPAPQAARAARPREPRGPGRRAAAPGVGSQAEYARHRGVSREAVRKAVRDGRIPVLPDGRIDFAAADLAWAANTDTARLPGAAADGAAPGPPPDLSATAAAAASAAEAGAGGSTNLPPGVTLNDARTLREWNQALKLILERRQLAAELVDAKQVEDAAFRAARSARERIMALPDRLDATLAATSDVAEVRRLLTEECRRVCEELSVAMLQDPDADEQQAEAS